MQELMKMIEEGKESLPSADQVLVNEANYQRLKPMLMKDRHRGETISDLEIKVLPGIPDNRVYVR